MFKKRYYVTVTPQRKDSRFVREAYSPLNKKQNFVLIHYMGDHTKAVQFSHGNAKSDRKPFFRTCPSVISAAKSSEELPSNVYKQLVSQPTHSSDLQPVLAPRNVKQIRNAQASQRQKCRLSHDTVYNLFEMAYDTQGFVHKIESYPDFPVIAVFHLYLMN